VQPPPPLTERDLEILSDLERLELPTLSWGIVDAALSRDDVLRAVEAAIDGAGDYVTAPQDVLDQLVRHAVLAPVVDKPDYFRTRFAEAVRLFARLRQLFPNHIRDQTWRAAPELVSDYRVLTRARRIPQRDVPPKGAIDEALAAAQHGSPTTSRLVLETLLGVGHEERPLARFQSEALRHILRMVDEQRTTATMITAGTGSGKTLAFYLPAFVDVVQQLDRSFWTKAVAIYPRVELLKDQLSEAVRHAQRLRPVLEKAGIRPVRIGAYFGSTPYRIGDNLEKRGWKQLGRQSHLSPFLLCWVCGAPTTWPSSRRAAGEEVLRCRDCGAESQPGDLALTREGMRANPPDILFTTTEMINRSLSSISYGHIFGAHRRTRSPRLVLLDEAHTYVGTTGAQTALLLRRWQHAIRAPLHVVGLSATLEDAQTFFARLTGVAESSVATIAPHATDLRDFGAEYLLALRGNPMSGTMLLSTTIQALMLLRRVEDPDSAHPTGGVFPPRVFAFTDDLDVTNRLYDYLLDAEGRSDNNAPRADSLASLRRPGPPDLEDRRQDGQVWDLPMQIGHTLSGSTTSISRTTSRDVGVSESSDIVVATSSLEVGFDDVRVGGVLQHKAPLETAAFIQRRGRGGRLPHARPWSVVVLSDFGRDRRAYQGFDSLFDPVLRPNALPVDNRHIIKVQAAYALLDWLALRMVDMGEGALWSDLAEPQNPATPWGRSAQQRQRRAASLLRSVLEDPREERSLAEHIRRALAISVEEAEIALWENPRSLMLSAVPTLLRRLETDWRNVSPPPRTDRHGRDPLPEHVPPNLFSELNPPEVDIAIPRRRGGDDLVEALAITAALRELTPGRVTRRFSSDDERRARHWVPLPAGGSGSVDVASFLLDYRELGRFTVSVRGQQIELPCLRPWGARLEIPGSSVEDSQSAVLTWSSQLLAPSEAVDFDIPVSTAWKRLIRAIKFHTHATRTEIEVRRLAVGAEASEPGHPERTRLLEFIRTDEDAESERVALGYSGDYDAIRVSLLVPSEWKLPEATLRALRRRWFDAQVQDSSILASHASVFSRSWLAVLYRAALTATASANNLSASDARDRLRDVLGASLVKAMRVVFEVSSPNPGINPADTRAETRLLDLIATVEVTDELHELAACLTGASEPPDAFVRDLYRATVAAAFKDAFSALAPTVNADSLHIDLPPATTQDDSGLVDIWLTEASVGGGGVVDQLLAAAVAEPRRLMMLAEFAVGESGYETVDNQVSASMHLGTSDPLVRSAFEQYRSAARGSDTRERFSELRELLQMRGVIWSHSVGTTLATRGLRPGSSAATDALILRIHERWSEIESLLGFETDARVIAFSLRDELDVENATGLTPPADVEAWRFSQIYGLIWPRRFEARTATLSAYTPFGWLPEPERLVVAPLLEEGRQRVEIDEGWRARVDDLLVRDGAAVLLVPVDSRDIAKEALLDLTSRPTDTGYLLAYPRVVGVTQTGGVTEISLELDETP
jgi:hypothetical protein